MEALGRTTWVIPEGYIPSGVLVSDVPVVVQHTRLDSRQAELTVLTTVAWPG